MCDRELNIRVDRLGGKTFPWGDKFLTLRVNEWDPASKIFLMLEQSYNVKRGSLKYWGVEIPYNGAHLKLYDIAAAFDCTVMRISVELDEKCVVATHQSPMILYVNALTSQSIPLIAESSCPVSRIKSAIQLKEGIPSAQQRLIYAGKQLEDGLTLAHYNIQSQSVLYLSLRLNGGGGGGRERGFMFADVSSEQHLHVEQWSREAPYWLRACPGLNLEGPCRNRNCAAFNQTVICMIGFGVTNVCRTKCNCPACNAEFAPITCGFSNCDWLCDGLKTNGAPVNLAWKTAGNAYHCFDTDGNMCEWEVVTIVCRRPEAQLAHTQDLRLRTSTGQCAVCWMRVADTVLVPCQHTLCPTCALRVHDCPQCRAPIASRRPA